jgi:hypothetical protein
MARVSVLSAGPRHFLVEVGIDGFIFPLIPGWMAAGRALRYRRFAAAQRRSKRPGAAICCCPRGALRNNRLRLAT